LGLKKKLYSSHCIFYPASIFGFFYFSQSHGKIDAAYNFKSSQKVSENIGDRSKISSNDPDLDINEYNNSLTPMESGDYFGPSLKSKDIKQKSYIKEIIKKIDLICCMKRTEQY